MKLSSVITLVLCWFLQLAPLCAQEYFDFCSGGTITPAEGIVDQLDQIVIDYTACEGTANGLNIGTGRGSNWITSDRGSHTVTLSDDYLNHRLCLTVADGPIVESGDYKLTIPEGALNVYGNPGLINEAASYYWTVTGSNDSGTAGSLSLVSSYPADGETIALPVMELSLTFNQDIILSHSMFDAAAHIANITSGGFIQLNMSAEGNTITMTRGTYSSTDFIAGQQYELEIYANHIKSASDPSITFPPTVIRFGISDEGSTDGLRVMAQIPAAGENIRNAGSVTFNMNLTSVDKDKITLVNDNGHSAVLCSAGIDTQSPKSLIFNIDENERLQGNTTYRLHLEAGAVTAGDASNEAMDAAYWRIPVELFTLQTALAGTAVPELSGLTAAAVATGIQASGDTSGIMITGVSTNAGHIYARLSSLALSESGGSTQIAITFDRTLTPAVLAEEGAVFNSVKVVIPEGTFSDGMGRQSKQAEFVVYIIEEKPIGQQTWTFDPADGSRVSRLGNPWFGEDDNGERITYYNIAFEVSGENVNARIPDGSLLYIRETASNQTVRTFERNSAIGYRNKFTLELGETAITEPGQYELVIPAGAVNLYYDADCVSQPVHPEEDVTARWTVGEPEAITLHHTDGNAGAAVDFWGRKTKSNTGLLIINGTKSLIP